MIHTPPLHLAALGLSVAGVFGSSVAAAQGTGTTPGHDFSYNLGNAATIDFGVDFGALCMADTQLVEQRIHLPISRIATRPLGPLGGGAKANWLLSAKPRLDFDQQQGCADGVIQANAVHAGAVRVVANQGAISFAVSDLGGMDVLDVQGTGTCPTSGVVQTVLAKADVWDAKSVEMAVPFRLQARSRVVISPLTVSIHTAPNGYIEHWANSAIGVVGIVHDLDADGVVDASEPVLLSSSATAQGLLQTSSAPSVEAELDRAHYIALAGYGRTYFASNDGRNIAFTDSWMGVCGNSGAFTAAIVVSAPVAVDDGGVLE